MKKVLYNEINLKNTVVALGKFEGLHLGHMLLIDKVIDLSKANHLDSVVCTIDTDGKKRILTLLERNTKLQDRGIAINVSCPFTTEFAAMPCGDFVKDILVERLGAKYIVVGEDFRFGSKRLGDVSTLVELGAKMDFEVVAFPKLTKDGQVVSSSKIREYIESGLIEKANDMLGDRYSISGIVQHGKKLGRTIGFPTVNLLPDDNKLLPYNGVYETCVKYGGISYKGITNVGGNPTVDSSGIIKIETNIFDFDMDIYNQEIQVEFVRFIRPEMKFESIDSLKNQIKKDKISIMHQ